MAVVWGLQVSTSLSGPVIPQYHELMWPALHALKQLGGGATVREMYERVVEEEGFSEEQQAVATKDGRMSEIEYRLHWAPARAVTAGIDGVGVYRLSVVSFPVYFQCKRYQETSRSAQCGTSAAP